MGPPGLPGPPGYPGQKGEKGDKGESVRLQFIFKIHILFAIIYFMSKSFVIVKFFLFHNLNVATYCFFNTLYEKKYNNRQSTVYLYYRFKNIFTFSCAYYHNK